VAKFPEPPRAGALRARLPPQIAVLPKGALIFRLYKRDGPHPSEWDLFRDYGPLKTMRFDHHEEPPHRQGRKILYGAAELATSVAEAFQEDRVVDRIRRAPWLVAFELERPVPVLDLAGHWPTAAGASMLIHSGQRARARRWSRRIFEDYPVVEGLRYCSSMNANRPAFAFYERADDALPARPSFHRPLSDPGLDGPLHVICGRLKYLMLSRKPPQALTR
jgi:hypothetical protein